LDNRYKYFKISWIVLIFGTVCDLTISEKLALGVLNVHIQLSSISALIYLLSFFIIFPINELPILFKNSFHKNNIFLFILLLLTAYLSSYLSFMQKYAIVTTTSRYTMYLLVFVITVYYSLYFEKAPEFILKSFIYLNFFIALSSLADYYLPGFYQVLVDYFGHMESRHSNIRIGGVIYLRPSGFVTDTNLTAFSLGFSSVILLINRIKFNKYFEYIFYVIVGYSFGMASSRSAFLIVIFLLAIILIFKQVSWKHAAVYVLLFITFQLLTPQTQARFFYFSDKKQKYEEMELGRPLIWKADYLAMRIKPVVGIGSGIFFKLSDTLISRVQNKITDEQLNTAIFDPRTDPSKGINPHNIFFTMIIEHGIAGAILFITLVLFNLFYFFKLKKYMSLAAAIGILFVSSLSNYAPYYKYYLLTFIVYYIISGLNLKLSNELPKSQ